LINTKNEINRTKDEINASLHSHTDNIHSHADNIQKHKEEVNLKIEEKEKINGYEEMKTQAMDNLAMSMPLMNFPMMGGGLAPSTIPFGLAPSTMPFYSNLRMMMLMQKCWNIYGQIEQINEYYRRMGCFFSN